MQQPVKNTEKPAQQALLELTRRLAQPKLAPTRRQEQTQRVRQWMARLRHGAPLESCQEGVRLRDVCLLMEFEQSARCMALCPTS